MAKFQERILTGDKALDRKLKHLERRAANKAARAGLSKGARVAAKAIKAEIPSSLKHIRKSIGSRVVKAKFGVSRGITQAKAGVNVGKKVAKRNATIHKDRGNKPGVGISAWNIHWWVLGTDERTQTTTGRSTGRMPEHPIVVSAMSKSKGTIAAAIREGVTKTLMREARKK